MIPFGEVRESTFVPDEFGLIIADKEKAPTVTTSCHRAGEKWSARLVRRVGSGEDICSGWVASVGEDRKKK